MGPSSPIFEKRREICSFVCGLLKGGTRDTTSENKKFSYPLKRSEKLKEKKKPRACSREHLKMKNLKMVQQKWKKKKKVATAESSKWWKIKKKKNKQTAQTAESIQI